MRGGRASEVRRRSPSGRRSASKPRRPAEPRSPLQPQHDRVQTPTVTLSALSAPAREQLLLLLSLAPTPPVVLAVGGAAEGVTLSVPVDNDTLQHYPALAEDLSSPRVWAGAAAAADLHAPAPDGDAAQQPAGELPSRPLVWLFRLIDDFCSSRAPAHPHRQFITASDEAISFSSAVYQYLAKQFGLDSLVKRAGSELLQCLRRYRASDLEAALFCALLTSRCYDGRDATFYITARASILNASQQAEPGPRRRIAASRVGRAIKAACAGSHAQVSLQRRVRAALAAMNVDALKPPPAAAFRPPFAADNPYVTAREESGLPRAAVPASVLLCLCVLNNKQLRLESEYPPHPRAADLAPCPRTRPEQPQRFAELQSADSRSDASSVSDQEMDRLLWQLEGGDAAHAAVAQHPHAGRGPAHSADADHFHPRYVPQHQQPTVADPAHTHFDPHAPTFSATPLPTYAPTHETAPSEDYLRSDEPSAEESAIVPSHIDTVVEHAPHAAVPLDADASKAVPHAAVSRVVAEWQPQDYERLKRALQSPTPLSPQDDLFRPPQPSNVGSPGACPPSGEDFVSGAGPPSVVCPPSGGAVDAAPSFVMRSDLSEQPAAATAVGGLALDNEWLAVLDALQRDEGAAGQPELRTEPGTELELPGLQVEPEPEPEPELELELEPEPEPVVQTRPGPRQPWRAADASVLRSRSPSHNTWSDLQQQRSASASRERELKEQQLEKQLNDLEAQVTAASERLRRFTERRSSDPPLREVPVNVPLPGKAPRPATPQQRNDSSLALTSPGSDLI